MVKANYEVIPEELKKTGKVSNPWPNVDAGSGALLNHYGLTQYDYYTVLFGVSRAFGCVPAQVWSRALGLPIERPNSLTFDDLKEQTAEASKPLSDNDPKPKVLVVNLEIKPERLEEFERAIKIDAAGSRYEKECYRFDVLRDPENKHKFVFYEAYKDDAALDFHKAAPHYQDWDKFYVTEGCKSLECNVYEGWDFPSRRQ